jgi:hypothetical protein
MERSRHSWYFWIDVNISRQSAIFISNHGKGIRLQAGLHREGGSRLQPRLHDLRHTMLKSLGQKTTVGEEFGMTFLEY